MPDHVVRCGPGQVPSAAAVESLYYAATYGSPLHEPRVTAAGYARLYAARLRRPDLEAVAARAAPGQLAGFAYGHGWRWAEQTDDWAVQLKERLAGAADLLDGRDGPLPAEGWEPIGHGPDTANVRPGLVLLHA